jgi:hypothetical protein
MLLTAESYFCQVPHVYVLASQQTAGAGLATAPLDSPSIESLFIIMYLTNFACTYSCESDRNSGMIAYFQGCVTGIFYEKKKKNKKIEVAEEVTAVQTPRFKGEVSWQ